MTITLEIPDDLIGALAPPGQEISRAALEALAVDGYRGGRLTETDVCQLLRFENRLEAHDFLSERGALLPFTLHAHAHEVARQVTRVARIQRHKVPANDRRRR